MTLPTSLGRRPIVAVMQPTFLPWQGYFALIAAADIFVFLDDVQFVRRTVHQRNRIFVNGADAGWIALPVEHSGRRMNLNEAKVSFDHTFARKLCAQLQMNYGRARYFDTMFPVLTDWLTGSEPGTIADRNIDLIRKCASVMNFSPSFIRSSTLHAEGIRSQRLLNILRVVDAGCYLSAKGSFGYMCEDGVFPTAEVPIVFQNFEQQTYPQSHSPIFVPYLSTVDALFEIGPAATRQLVISGMRTPMSWELLAVEHSRSSAISTAGLAAEVDQAMP